MCYYLTYKLKYKGCEANPQHVVTVTKYDRCEKAINSGYTCTDATPAKGKNGKVIQTGTSPAVGKCPRCLS